MSIKFLNAFGNYKCQHTAGPYAPLLVKSFKGKMNVVLSFTQINMSSLIFIIVGLLAGALLVALIVLFVRKPVTRE